MSDHDLQLLALGTALGIYIMLFVQIVFGVLDDRRDRRVAQAAKAKLEAAQQAADA